jgi:hypothetical protein
MGIPVAMAMDGCVFRIGLVVQEVLLQLGAPAAMAAPGKVRPAMAVQAASGLDLVAAGQAEGQGRVRGFIQTGVDPVARAGMVPPVLTGTEGVR